MYCTYNTYYGCMDGYQHIYILRAGCTRWWYRLDCLIDSIFCCGGGSVMNSFGAVTICIVYVYLTEIFTFGLFLVWCCFDVLVGGRQAACFLFLLSEMRLSTRQGETEWLAFCWARFRCGSVAKPWHCLEHLLAFVGICLGLACS